INNGIGASTAGTSITNNGTITLSSVISDVILTNNGRINVTANSGINNQSFAGQVYNHGTASVLNISGGADLNLGGGNTGTHTFANGAAVSGAGSLTLGGTGRTVNINTTSFAPGTFTAQSNSGAVNINVGTIAPTVFNIGNNTTNVNVTTALAL